MKAVILCGGLGTRLRPLTNIYNKNLLPLGSKFMIDFPLEAVKKTEFIKEVLIITGPEKIGNLVDLVGSGEKYGLSVTYKIQDKPLGIAHGIGLAEDFAGKEDILVILGDNIFDFDLTNDLMCATMDGQASIALKRVSDPERFGVMEFNPDSTPKRIIEKPKVAPSNHAVIGVYSYPPDVFEKIKILKPSDRGEYEVTDLNNLYIAEGKMRCYDLEGFWVDAGTHDTYQKAFEWASRYAD